MTRTFVLGAVAYDPKVVTIWEGFRAHFARRGFAFDYILFSNYERQVAALLAGHVDIAWNSPLAWIEAARLGARHGRRARALAMRDTDQDLTSVIVSGTELRSLEDLRGRRIAVGASDSPQATIIPLELLAQAGLEAGRDMEVVRFEVGVGLHGDHVGGERDAARALAAGRVEAACMLDSNHLAFTREGTISASATKVLAQTPAFDHCNFTAMEGACDAQAARFTELLLGMSYEDGEVRPLLDLEGLRAWKVGRTSGYGPLESALSRGGAIERFLALTEACA